MSCPLERIGLAQTGPFIGFDFWADQFVGPFTGALESDLPPASCRILAVRPVSGQPQVISTSRHITQGVVDLLEETWDAAVRELRGVSRVVANDPYELRIAALGVSTNWQVAETNVSPEDAAAGVTISPARQESWKVRVQIDSRTSRDVHWTVRFPSLR